MSFTDEIRQELTHAPQPKEGGDSRLPFSRERFEKFFRKELENLQSIIREDVRSGRFSASGDKHLFQGVRSWPDGDMVLEKEILEQQKRLMGGYRYALRFSLTPEGENCLRLFSEAMQQEGLEITGLFVQQPDGSRSDLPYTARGTAKYDFELEHHLNDYPALCYGWRMEV